MGLVTKNALLPRASSRVSLVVPVSLHDVDGRFVHMNAAAERAPVLRPQRPDAGPR
jgi:hypothetical protein